MSHRSFVIPEDDLRKLTDENDQLKRAMIDLADTLEAKVEEISFEIELLRRAAATTKCDRCCNWHYPVCGGKS